MRDAASTLEVRGCGWLNQPYMYTRTGSPPRTSKRCVKAMVFYMSSFFCTTNVLHVLSLSLSRPCPISPATHISHPLYPTASPRMHHSIPFTPLESACLLPLHHAPETRTLLIALLSSPCLAADVHSRDHIRHLLERLDLPKPRRDRGTARPARSLPRARCDAGSRDAGSSRDQLAGGGAP